MAPRRTDGNVLLEHFGNKELVAEDINKVRHYVKEDLFERLVFVWNDGALNTGGVLHGDFLRNCRPLLADGTLVDLMDNEANTYMNGIWEKLVADNSYTTWLRQVRSSRYQAVENMFKSKYIRGDWYSKLQAILHAS